MIPNIIPPPIWLPQGWSPNALRPTNAAIQQIASQMSAAQVQNLLATGGSILTASGTLTKSDLDTLNAAPVTAVPAPAAGLVLVPIAFEIITDVGAAITWSNAPSYQIVFAGNTTNLMVGTVPSNLSGAGPYTTIGFTAGPAAAGFLASSFDPRAKALQIRFTADAIISGGAGPTTAPWKLAYMVMGG